MSNVNELIEKAKEAIKQHDTDTAVKYDSALHQYLKTGLNNVRDQAELHKNQYDFIFKYRLKYYFIEIVYVAIIFWGIVFTVTHSGWNAILYGGVSLYIFFKLFGHFTRHRNGIETTKNQEDAIVLEKMNHEKVLGDLSKITQYQQQTFKDMSKLYEEYEEKIQNEYNAGGLFGLGDKGDQAEEHD